MTNSEENRRSTTLFDINGKEIFEGDIIIQEKQDRPFSAKMKKKKIKGVVRWYPASKGLTGCQEKRDGYPINTPPHWGVDFSIDQENADQYQVCNWGPFFKCEVIGREGENQ